MVDLKNLLDDASREDGRSVDALDALDVVHAGRRRVRRRGLLRAGAALALVLVVAATALTVRPWESEEPRMLQPVSPPAPKVSPLAPEDSEFTSPGSLLDIGETARVPVVHAVGRGKVELTVTAVRRGDTADLLSDPETSDFLRQLLETGQIWYVDVTIKYLSGRIGGYYLDPDVEPVLRGGGGHNQVSYLVDFAPCPSRGLSHPAVPGESVKDCVAFRTPPGTDVVGLRWGPYETSYYVGTEKPVVWR